MTFSNETLQFFNATKQLYSDSSRALLIFKATAIGVIIVLNILANSLTLIILWKCHKINSVTRVFMTSMTMSDLGLGLVLVPALVATIFDRWPFGEVLCSITGCLTGLFCYTSPMSLFSLTCERFLAVTRPFQHRALMTASRAYVISLGVWMFCLVGAALNGFLPGRSIYFSPGLHMCYMFIEDPSAADIEGAIFTLTFIAVPFGLILLMFIRLLLLARFHAAKIAAQERTAGKKSDRRALTTFVIMTGCLSIGWAPLITVALYINVNGSNGSVLMWLLCVAELAAFSNAVINVLVYYVRNTAFRHTAKTLLVCRIPCIKIISETSSIPLDTLQ